MQEGAGIKVLHTEWSDGFGGQEIRIINEMKAMRALGCTLALATRENTQILKKAQELGFETFTLPFKNGGDLKTIMGLQKIIKNHKFDICNTHSSPDTWCGGIATKFVGKKFIRTRHLSTPISPSRFNFINGLADFIFTTGESIRESMIENNHIRPEKILSVPTGIATNTFDPAIHSKKEAREALELPQEAIIIGNLGVLRSFKRMDIFINTAPLVLQTYPNAYFVIAGGGSNEAREGLGGLITKLNLQERVKLLGHVEKPEIFLKALDVFMLTSDKGEGVPQSLMQALAMQLPCIASNIGSIADLWHKNNFILIPPTQHAEIFAKALLSLLENPKIVEIDRQFIVDNFSLSKMSWTILKVYHKLLGIH